jgi:hypothetical protein
MPLKHPHEVSYLVSTDRQNGWLIPANIGRLFSLLTSFLSPAANKQYMEQLQAQPREEVAQGPLPETAADVCEPLYLNVLDQGDPSLRCESLCLIPCSQCPSNCVVCIRTKFEVLVFRRHGQTEMVVGLFEAPARVRIADYLSVASVILHHHGMVYRSIGPETLSRETEVLLPTMPQP